MRRVGYPLLPVLSGEAALSGKDPDCHLPLQDAPRLTRNFELFPALDWLAALTAHIPNHGEHVVRYSGWYSNVSAAVELLSYIGRLSVGGSAHVSEIALPLLLFLLGAFRQPSTQVSPTLSNSSILTATDGVGRWISRSILPRSSWETSHTSSSWRGHGWRIAPPRPTHKKGFAGYPALAWHFVSVDYTPVILSAIHWSQRPLSSSLGLLPFIEA